MAVSCGVRNADPEPEDDARGRLDISLSCAELYTKAGTPEEGYSFKNVLLVVTNGANKVIASSYEVFGTPVTQRVVSFVDLKVGNYNVYAYANIGHTGWQVAGRTIAETEKILVGNRDGGETLDPDRLLATLGGSETPEDPALLATPEPMLMTGYKALSVGVNENIGEIELLRPVSKFSVFVHNHTGYPITVKELSFTDFNASDSYLISHPAGNGIPGIPAGNIYRSLPAYDASNPVVIEPADPGDEESGMKLVYSKLLYENMPGKEYRMFSTVSMDTGSGVRELELQQSGVRQVTVEDIENMEVGEVKTVMMVNPNTKTGYFYGKKSTSLVCVVANYTFEESFSQRTESILDNKEIADYYKLTLKKEESGKISLKAGTVTMFPGNVEIANIAQAADPADADFPVSSEFGGYLFLLSNPSNGQYLYNNNKSLNFGTGNQTKGNRLWAFYEVNPTGSMLRLIDKETAQVTPLRYMRRNQELKVVLNVYSGTLPGEFDFKLDNAYWADGHHSGHVFK